MQLEKPSLAIVTITTKLIPRRKRKPTLDDLAALIQEAHHKVDFLGSRTKYLALLTIRHAVECGGYLREAKSRPELGHGKFTSWMKKLLNERSGQNYMRLHKWIQGHGPEIAKRKPTTLTALYRMCGILPEDETDKPRESKDDYGKVRRLGRKLCIEVASLRDFGDPKDLDKALSEVKRMIIDVSTDTTPRPKPQRFSVFDAED